MFIILHSPDLNGGTPLNLLFGTSNTRAAATAESCLACGAVEWESVVPGSYAASVLRESFGLTWRNSFRHSHRTNCNNLFSVVFTLKCRLTAQTSGIGLRNGVMPRRSEIENRAANMGTVCLCHGVSVYDIEWNAHREAEWCHHEQLRRSQNGARSWW